MKVAAILTVGLVMLSPHMAFAQNAGSDAANHIMRSEGGRAAHAATPSAPRAANDSDRAIDAELRRIDRMMTICTGC